VKKWGMISVILMKMKTCMTRRRRGCGGRRVYEEGED
jgi:hypothetical protein